MRRLIALSLSLLPFYVQADPVRAEDERAAAATEFAKGSGSRIKVTPLVDQLLASRDQVAHSLESGKRREALGAASQGRRAASRGSKSSGWDNATRWVGSALKRFKVRPGRCKAS